MGVFPNYPELEALKLKEGRFINERDMAERRKVMILHEKTVGMLFPQGHAIGKYVNASGVSYQIVGVYKDQNSFSPTALVPFTTLQTVYSKGDSIDNITFTTKGLTNEADNDAFEADYRRMLEARNNSTRLTTVPFGYGTASRNTFSSRLPQRSCI